MIDVLKIKKQMVDELRPLFVLIKKANEQIDISKENGYKINIIATGPFNCISIKEIILLEFSKNLVGDKGNRISPLSLKDILKKITKILSAFYDEGLCIEIDIRRTTIYVKQVFIRHSSIDFNQSYVRKRWLIIL